jgi:hypothetical protein
LFASVRISIQEQPHAQEDDRRADKPLHGQSFVKEQSTTGGLITEAKENERHQCDRRPFAEEERYSHREHEVDGGGRDGRRERVSLVEPLDEEVQHETIRREHEPDEQHANE